MIINGAWILAIAFLYCAYRLACWIEDRLYPAANATISEATESSSEAIEIARDANVMRRENRSARAAISIDCVTSSRAATAASRLATAASAPPTNHSPAVCTTRSSSMVVSVHPVTDRENVWVRDADQ